ncbi:MAG: carbohydrate binding domain-containing protein [Clostridia bacterium]|nr:carbohydrate binding domain-containing protein [Clostridia bacterium]
MKRLLSLVLSAVMIFTCIGMGICVFAEDNPWSEMFPDYYYGETAYGGGHIYTAQGGSLYYDAPPATITTLFDKTIKATVDTPVILYTVNTNTERIGTDSDETIITDLLSREYIVLVVDYHNDPRADAVTSAFSLQEIRNSVKSGSSGKYINFSGMFTGTAAVSPYTYILPAGYNITLGVTYWSIDKHSSDGTLERIVEIWNSDFKGVMGNKVISFPDGTQQTVSEYTGSGITEIFDCVRPNGELIDMDLKMDIIYPTNPGYNVPVMTNASSSESRERSWTLAARPHLTGFLFMGYAGINYDYGYTPMARTDHYGYFDGDTSTGHVTGDNKTYSIAVYNHSKCDSAAMRKIRSLADEEPAKYQFDPDAIGVMSNSKGGLVTRLGNEHPEELTEWRFLPGHHGESRYEAGNTDDETKTYTYGDTTIIRTIRGGEEQPWLTYQDGSKIPSKANFIYANCGGGYETITEGNSPMFLTGTMENNGSYYDFVPATMSACYNSDVPVMYYANPGIGHALAVGLDRDHNQDVYLGLMKTSDYYLRHTPVSVAYIEPDDNSTGIDPKSVITVKFFGQVDETEIQKITVTGSDGSVVHGVWKGSYGDSTWEFSPADMKDGMEYTVTVPKTLAGKNGKTMEADYSQSYTTWPGAQKEAVKIESDNGAEIIAQTDSGSNGIYLLFENNAEDFKNAGQIGLRFFVTNDAANTAEVYALENINPDNLPESSRGEKIGEVVLTGAGEYEVDISEYIEAAKTQQYLGFLIAAKKKTETVVINKYDFESAAVGAASISGVTFQSLAVGESVQTIAKDGNADNKAVRITNYNDNSSASSPTRLPWVLNPANVLIFTQATKESSLTEDDYGRLFHIDVDVYDTKNGGRKIFLSLGTNDLSKAAGLDDVDLKQRRLTRYSQENQWTTVSMDCRIDNPLYWGLLQKQRLEIAADTSGTPCANNPENPFYIDNVTITEEITDIVLQSETSAPVMILYNEETVKTTPENASYVQNGSKVDTSFENAEEWLVSDANVSMSGENKKTYARIPVSEYDESKPAGISFSVTEGNGTVAVYGITDPTEAENWDADTINYINAYGNDRYSYGVDMGKVYGSAPLDTITVTGGGTYTMDITAYMTYMKEQGAEYATLIFTLDSEPVGTVKTMSFDDMTGWIIKSYANYNSTTQNMAFSGFNENMNPGSFGTYGTFLDSSVNHGSGSGKSLWYRANTAGARAKLTNLFGTITEEDLGKTYRVSFWILSDTEDASCYVELNSSGSGSTWQVKGYTPEKNVPVGKTWKQYSYDVTITEDMLISKYSDSSNPERQVPALLSFRPSAKDITLWIDDIEVEDISSTKLDFTVADTSSDVTGLNYRFTRDFDDMASLKKLYNAPYNSTTNVLAYAGCSPTMQSTMKLDSTENHGGDAGKSLFVQPDATYCRLKFPGLFGTLDENDIGSTYHVSFWAKSSIGGSITMEITSAASSSTYVTTSYIPAVNEKFNGINEWQQFEYDVTIDQKMLSSSYTADETYTAEQKNPALFTVTTTDVTSGTLWIDDFVVTAKTHAEEGKSLGADQVAAVSGVKFDGTTGVGRVDADGGTTEGIRKTYMHFGGVELTNLSSAALELDVSSAIGQTMSIYGITGIDYPAEPLTWNNAPANAAGTGIKTANVFGGAPLAVLKAQKGTMRIDITDYITDLNGVDPIFAITSDAGSGQEYVRLDFESFGLTGGLDYNTDGAVNFSTGAANVSGQNLVLLNMFGNNNLPVVPGQIYTITADITSSSGGNISIGISDKDGGNVAGTMTETLSAGETKAITFSYAVGDEDAVRELCAVAINSDTAGFTVDNVNVSSESPILMLSGARIAASYAAVNVTNLAISNVVYDTVDNNYLFDISLSKESDGVIVVALYDAEGILIGSSLQPISGTDAAEVSVPYAAEAVSAKVLLWNNLDKALTPLCDDHSVTFVK